MTPRVQKAILIALVTLHVSFYVSALWTNHFQAFYPWGTIHQAEYKFIDYYQIPNGARGFLQNRNIAGNQSPVVVNFNVYHPIATFLIGIPLQLLTPAAGFIVYTLCKLLITAGIAYCLYRRFRNHPSFFPAACVFLGFFAQVVEIGIGQYHCLLTAATYGLLLSLQSSRSIKQSMWFLIGLLVKPVGLLFFPAMFFGRARKACLMGIAIFAALTAVCYRFGLTTIYMMNISGRVFTPLEVFLMTPTLEGILRTLGLPSYGWLTVKGTFAGMILMFQMLRRPSLLIGLFQWVSYSLVCYSLSYDYHYTLLIPFLVLGLLREPAFNGTLAKGVIALCCLPSPFILLKHFNAFFIPDGLGHHVASRLGSVTIESYRVLPVIALNFIVGWHLVRKGVKMLRDRAYLQEVEAALPSEKPSFDLAKGA